MRPIKIGDIEIWRILEWEGPFLPIGEMFPDATAEALEPHRTWLEPWALCPQTGRMILPVQSYLVKTSRHTILLDTCIGNHKSNQFFKPWYNRQDASWMHALTHAGVTPEQVDYVLCTHLHLDHSGWNTKLLDGRWVPTFPNAKYIFAREEFDERQAIGGTSFEENIVPVMDAGQGVLVAMDHALDDQVWLTPTPGHTRGHVSIHLASKGKQAVMMGDLMHSPVQCAEPHWHAVSDGDPELARKTRHAFLETHAGTETLILTAHFPSPSVGRIHGKGQAFRFGYE